MKVRSFMAALPMGTVSTSGFWVSTKPPTCWERWRGKPISSWVSSRASFSRGSSGRSPAPATCSSVSPSPQEPQTVLARAEVTSSVRPSALPTSRTAERLR